MLRLQMFTGMPPGEAVAMRAEELDRTGEDWLYRPARHMTEGQGRSRAIPLGARAQEVIGPFLTASGPTGYLFSPAAAVAAWNERRRKERVTPMTPYQIAR
jgi:integrase